MEDAGRLTNTPRVISFSKGSLQFRYDTATNFFECIGRKGTPLSNHIPKILLAKLIEAAPESVTKDVLMTNPIVASDNALQVQIRLVRELLADLAQDPTLRRASLVKSVHGHGYSLNPDDLDIQKFHFETEDIKEEDFEWFQDERVGYNNIKLLISDLIDTFPTELDGFFTQGTQGARLPVFVMPEAKFGRLSFPVAIDHSRLPAPERGTKSIARRRKAMGKEVYPGQIYRLHTASHEGWRIGKTVYTELIDDCDYLKSRILAGWGRVCEKDKESRRQFLTRSKVVNEWLQRVDKIKSGDFTHYHAGMGISTPIFREVPNGTLELICARGSFEKQADGGKIHVCPAGMLEYGLGAIKATHLTAEDFGTYALKEMIEETLRGDAFKEGVRMDILDAQNGPGDVLDTRTLKHHCMSILDGVAEEISSGKLNVKLEDGTNAKLSLAAANASACLHETLNSRELHVVVDAFVLRPEIIVPIFVSEPLDVLLSWENDKPYKYVFNDLDDVEALISKIGSWTAPGLAAAYLTARNWFLQRGL